MALNVSVRSKQVIDFVETTGSLSFNEVEPVEIDNHAVDASTNI